MQGKIVKGIAGFYYVHTEDAGVFECKAKGIFRNQNIKPLVGDNVELEILDEEKKLASVVELLPRKSQLLRPAVANVDQAIVVFAAKDPEPNRNLLNRFLILMTKQELPVIIVFNKTDLISEEEKKKLEDGWRNTGYEIRFLSAKESQGTEEFKNLLRGKTTVMAGPSGVGKSTLVNLCQSGVIMETGVVSEKIKRGKHTTRHSEFIRVDEETYILDTPGFSSLSIFDMEKEALEAYYEEFQPLTDGCKFTGCSHIHEPVCGVKEGLKTGKVSAERYENYKLIYQELAQKKKY